MPRNRRGGRFELRIPFVDQTVSSYSDEDGKYYTSHPLLRGPFDSIPDIFLAASLLFRDRTQRPVVTQEGAPSRTRSARRTRGAAAPVVTEHLQAAPPPSEKLVAGVAESASALTLQEPDVSSSEVLLNTTASEEMVIDNDISTDVSPPPVSLGPKIYIRRPPNWYQVYFIRMDILGSFCVYPHIGGPFQSLDEADCAINRHVSELQRPAMCKEQGETSFVDRLVHQCMHYADGTPKRGPNLRKRKNTESEQHCLVQALVEQYNDSYNLFGDFAHELESLVRHELIFENDRWFYHFNFTTKAKEANGTVSSSNLFFAEVSHMQGEDAWEVSCCRMINSKDDGQGHCYGCRNNGSPDMQHPNDTGAYTGGHLDEYLPFGGDESSGPEDEEAVEGRLRRIYKELDDPSVWEKIYSYVDRTDR